jgi:hypothetical protein
MRNKVELEVSSKEGKNKQPSFEEAGLSSFQAATFTAHDLPSKAPIPIVKIGKWILHRQVS